MRVPYRWEVELANGSTVICKGYVEGGVFMITTVSTIGIFCPGCPRALKDCECHDDGKGTE